MAHGIRAHWPTARNCPVFPVYVLALPRPALEKTLRGPTSVYGRRGDPGEGFYLITAYVPGFRLEVPPRRHSCSSLYRGLKPSMSRALLMGKRSPGRSWKMWKTS